MKDFDPAAYRVTVQHRDVDGESYFVGEVAEFPDVEVFEDSADAAYTGVLEVISSLHDLYRETGREFPLPTIIVESEYSGRVTLRLPKTLHKSLDEQAKMEGVSLNTHLIFRLSANSGEIRSAENRVISGYLGFASNRESTYLYAQEIKFIDDKAHLVKLEADPVPIGKAYSYTTEIEYVPSVTH